jgi:hypothetical protein
MYLNVLIIGILPIYMLVYTFDEKYNEDMQEHTTIWAPGPAAGGTQFLLQDLHRGKTSNAQVQYVLVVCTGIY